MSSKLTVIGQGSSNHCKLICKRTKIKRTSEMNTHSSCCWAHPHQGDAALDVIVVNPLHIGGTMNMCWGHFFYCRSHMYNIKSIALTQPNPTSTPTLTQPYLECLVGDELLCLASCLFSSLSHLLCQVSHFLQNKTRGLQL